MKRRAITKPLARILPGCLLALFLAAPVFGAEISASDKATAAALFAEARALFDQGKTAEALAKYEASQRLDPTVGALLNIARCHEKLGHYASAWGAADAAEILAKKLGDEERRAYSANWKKQLDPKLARLRIDVAPDAQGIQIRLDGKPLPAGALSSALPVDPGDHAVDVDADGKPLWHVPVHIDAKPGTMVVRVPAPGAPPFWNGQRIASVAMGGVGVAGIVVGAVFGVRAANLMDESKPHCVDLNPDPCDRQGVTLRDQADASAWVSNISIGVGAAAIAGGVVLFLTAPSSRPSKPDTVARIEILPTATPVTQGLIVRGTF
jgi:hypothetical protein